MISLGKCEFFHRYFLAGAKEGYVFRPVCHFVRVLLEWIIMYYRLQRRPGTPSPWTRYTPRPGTPPQDQVHLGQERIQQTK